MAELCEELLSLKLPMHIIPNMIIILTISLSVLIFVS